MLFLLPSALSAQDAPAWSVTLLRMDEDAWDVVTLTPDGMSDPRAVPDTFPRASDDIALSPDGRLLATLDEGLNTVVIADLEAGTCCAEYTFTDTLPDDASLGGFSPDGTKIAAAYMLEEPFAAHAVALGVATGEVAASTDLTLDLQSGLLKVYPQFVEWRADGVVFDPLCIQCVEGAQGDARGLWNPETGGVTQTGETADPRADLLPLGFAALIPTYAADYPAYPNPDMIAVGGETYGLRNSVTLSGAKAENGRSVVYFDPENLRVESARWVADGNAFLVFALDTNVLVLDDGTTQPIDFGAHQFVAGTPDGWLMVNEGGQVIHVALDGGEREHTVIAPLTGTFRVLAQTPLGSEGGAAFPTIPPPEPVTCEGAAESRLLVGHRARVRPGPNNLVRDIPSTTGTIVARMAGESLFVVLEGPTCAEGLAWWRVAFQQWEGWTAEGSGANYYLEPVD